MNSTHEPNAPLSSVELFPPPASPACSVPNLPEPRAGHSLSLLSGGRLVLCGGFNGKESLASCISWVAGDSSWTHFHNMRCRLDFISKMPLISTQTIAIQYYQHGPILAYSLDSKITPQLCCADWRARPNKSR